MGTPAKKIGRLIAQARKSKRLSLTALAKQAGVAKSTLSYWECGSRVPSMAELDAVLSALEASSSLRAELLRHAEASRSVRELKEIAADEWPVTGSLLRAMRLRIAWSQERLADALDVRQSTVAKWERSESWPSAELLQSVCFTLGASVEELEAVMRGRLLTGDAQDITFQSCIDRFWIAMYYGPRETRDLAYLSLEADLSLCSDGQSWSVPLLAEVYGRHAQFLADEDRMTESRAAASSSMRLGDSCEVHPARLAPAAVAFARATTASSGGRISDAIDLLSSWVGSIQSPEYRAWLLSELASYHAAKRNSYEARELSEQACAEARTCDNLAELENRTLDFARCLLKLGKPDEALSLLPKSLSPTEVSSVSEAVVYGSAVAALGQGDASELWLARILELGATSSNPREQRMAQNFASLR